MAFRVNHIYRAFLLLQEILNQAEFEEGGPTKEYDEDLSNSAVELGLLVSNANPQKKHILF